MLGSIEYACAVVGAKLIVVMGHSNSEVMRIAVESFLSQRKATDRVGCTNLDPIVAEIQESIDPARVHGWRDLDAIDQQDIMDDLYRAHISATAEKIIVRSPSLGVAGRDGSSQGRWGIV